MPKVLTNAEAVRASVLQGAKYHDGTPVSRHTPAPRTPAPADKLDRVIAKLDALKSAPASPAPEAKLDDSRIVAAIQSLKDSMLQPVETTDAPPKPLDLVFRVMSRDGEGRVLEFSVREAG